LIRCKIEKKAWALMNNNKFVCLIVIVMMDNLPKINGNVL
jgi:hypothetical protein